MSASKTFEQKILFTGTQAQYAAATKSDAGLYFTSDTHKLYKGSVDFSEAVRVVSTLPAAGSAANGILYVVVSSGVVTSAAVTTNGGTSYTTVVLGNITSIVENSATDLNVPTTKAVVDYVVSKVGTSGAVNDIQASSTAAQFNYTKAGDATALSNTVEVPGVVTNPTWNSSTRTLTMDVTEVGSTAAHTVTVAIGHDLVVTAGRYNVATEEIWLWITDQDPQTDEPSIKIPVGDLVDMIQVSDTSTVDLTYTTATNTLSADVKVSAKTGNYLSIVTGDSTASNNGLMVDLTTIETAIATAEDNIDALYTALTTWAAIPTTP